MKPKNVLLTLILLSFPSFCFAFPDDVEKIIEKKVNDERNWTGSRNEYMDKKLALMQSESYKLSTKLLSIKMNISFNEASYNSNKALAKAVEDPSKKEKFKRDYMRNSEEIKILKNELDEIICPNLIQKVNEYVHEKANSRYTSLADLKLARGDLERAIDKVDYKKCLPELQN